MFQGILPPSIDVMMYRSFLPKEQCFRGTGAEHNPQVLCTFSDLRLKIWVSLDDWLHDVLKFQLPRWLSTSQERNFQQSRFLNPFLDGVWPQFLQHQTTFFSGCDYDSLRISWHFHGYLPFWTMVSPALDAAWWPYKMPTCRRKMMATRKITMAIINGTNLWSRRQATTGAIWRSGNKKFGKRLNKDKVRPRYCLLVSKENCHSIIS